MKRQRTTRRSQGVSIVEIIVALGMLTFGAYAIFGHFAEAHRQGARHEQSIQRNLWAQQRMQELLACPYAELERWSPPANPEPLAGHEGWMQQVHLSKRADGLMEIIVKIGMKGEEPAMPMLEAGSLTLRGVRAR